MFLPVFFETSDSDHMFFILFLIFMKVIDTIANNVRIVQVWNSGIVGLGFIVGLGLVVWFWVGVVVGCCVGWGVP